MARQETVKLTLTADDAHAVNEALAYYYMAAANNFGAGYERGNPDDTERRDVHRRVKKIEYRLYKRLEKAGRY